MILCDGNYGVGAYGMDLVHNWEPERSRVAIFFVKGSHRPRPLTRLRRSLIDKTTPITLIRTRRMHIDEIVCIMAVSGWRSASVGGRFFY